MIRLIWSVIIIALVLSGCGNGTPTRQNTFTPLTSIEITAVNSTIAATTSTRLTATGNYSGLFKRDITAQVTWSSDAPTVANKFTTAAATNQAWVTSGSVPGTANLTATVTNTSGTVVSATFKLTVTAAAIQSMTIKQVNPSIHKGQNFQFTAEGAFSDTTTQDMTFDANWTSSDPTVASISNAAGSNGFAQTSQATIVGPTTITAIFGGKSDTSVLTVTDPLLQSITVSPVNPSVLSLSTANFTATGNYSDKSTADITSQVAWSSSDTSKATIAATGVATTLAQGTTNISATLVNADGTPVTGTKTLNVTGGTLTSIAVSTATLSGIPNAVANLTMAQGTSVRITATGTFSNGASRDITRVVTWTTGNAALATVTVPVVNPPGNLAWLNAVAATSTPTTVTATYVGTVNGTTNPTGTTNLTVTAPTLSSITVSTPTLNSIVGASSRINVTANFSDGSNQDVTANSTWTSSATTIATVGDTGIAKGLVSGVAAGSATISAAYGGLTVTTPVTVTAPTLQSLAISNPSGSLTAGNQVRFTATATYTGGTTVDVTELATWTIDNQNVAILADSASQPGQVVAVGSGSAVLTASFGGLSAPALTITVP